MCKDLVFAKLTAAEEVAGCQKLIISDLKDGRFSYKDVVHSQFGHIFRRCHVKLIVCHIMTFQKILQFFAVWTNFQGIYCYFWTIRHKKSPKGDCMIV